MPKLYAVLILAFVLSACKIQVNVPEDGGRVETLSGTVICEPGKSCEVEVTDLLFEETFVARPYAGYRFEGWEVRQRGLCGGGDGDCHLYTSGFDGIDALLDFLDSPEEIFYLNPEFTLLQEDDDYLPIYGEIDVAHGSFWIPSIYNPSFSLREISPLTTELEFTSSLDWAGGYLSFDGYVSLDFR